MQRVLLWLRYLILPPADSARWIRTSTLFFSALFFMGVLVVSSYTWEYTNSPEFCGTGCHTMPPEYTAYQRSPHAQVKCVECHIGREFIGNQLTRKVGDVRHVIAQISQRYEYPIRVKNLRPANEVCERCHDSNKFSDDTERMIVHYQPDLENTPQYVYLRLKTGGGQAEKGLGRGIHWHIQNPVYYYATDEQEQQIPYVKVVNQSDGTTMEYVDLFADFDPYGLDESRLRRVDCITCHNRVSHAIPKPERAVERAMALGLVSPEIPEIRRKAVEVLRGSYASQDQALAAIQGLSSYYQQAHPDFFEHNSELLFQALEELKSIYTQSVFPDQKVDWDTHIDNLGHQDAPGCFRCHDGKHLSQTGEAIPLSCNLCHAIPVVSTPEDQIVHLDINRLPLPDTHSNSNWSVLHKYMYDPQDEDEACSGCHDVSNYDQVDNTSFCANSACHGLSWNTLELEKLSDPALLQTFLLQFPHYPASLEGLQPWGTPTSLDAIHREQESLVCEDCHETFPPYAPPDNQVCISCHGETLQGLRDLTVDWKPNPHDGHEGQVSCSLCHPNFGPPIAPCALCHDDVPLVPREEQAGGG